MWKKNRKRQRPRLPPKQNGETGKAFLIHQRKGKSPHSGGWFIYRHRPNFHRTMKHVEKLNYEKLHIQYLPYNMKRNIPNFVYPIRLLTDITTKHHCATFLILQIYPLIRRKPLLPLSSHSDQQGRVILIQSTKQGIIDSYSAKHSMSVQVHPSYGVDPILDGPSRTAMGGALNPGSINVLWGAERMLYKYSGSEMDLWNQERCPLWVSILWAPSSLPFTLQWANSHLKVLCVALKSPLVKS